MPSPTVRIVAHTFVSPSGELRTVHNDGAKFTSRNRAEQYCNPKTGPAVARYEDESGEAMYFLDPAPIQTRMIERADGIRHRFVGESGGSSFVNKYADQTSGTRMFMTSGTEKSFMDA